MYSGDEGLRAEKPYCREQNANERKRNTKNQRKNYVGLRITALALSKLDLYKLQVFGQFNFAIAHLHFICYI